MRASILTYHSGNIAGNDYASNNLLALAHDLDVVRALRLPVVALRRVVDALLDRTSGTPFTALSGPRTPSCATMRSGTACSSMRPRS
jgi:hypothetical protein